MIFQYVIMYSMYTHRMFGFLNPVGHVAGAVAVAVAGAGGGIESSLQTLQSCSGKMNIRMIILKKQIWFSKFEPHSVLPLI